MDECLGGEMKNYLGRTFFERAPERFSILHIADNRSNPLRRTGRLKQARPLGRKRVPGNDRACIVEPVNQPRSFKAGMSGHKDAPAAIPRPKSPVHVVTTHGAFPLRHNSSRTIFSRRVSMG